MTGHCPCGRLHLTRAWSSPCTAVKFAAKYLSHVRAVELGAYQDHPRTITRGFKSDGVGVVAVKELAHSAKGGSDVGCGHSYLDDLHSEPPRERIFAR